MINDLGRTSDRVFQIVGNLTIIISIIVTSCATYVFARTGEKNLWTVTRLADYLRAEQRDKSEPASFYVPGAQDWDDPRCRCGHPCGARDTLSDAEQDAALDDPEAPDDEPDDDLTATCAAAVFHSLEED